MAWSHHGHPGGQCIGLFGLDAATGKKRSRDNDACVEKSKATDDCGEQIGESGQNSVTMQKHIHFEQECRERRKTSDKADGKQQAVLIRNDAGCIKPLGTCHKLGDYAHEQATKQIGAERTEWQGDIALQSDD